MERQRRAASSSDQRIGLTAPEYYTTLACIFAFGCFVGWALFGQSFELANRAWGNVAEWLAAIGTIIVGFGAWKYARATLLHTLAQSDEEAARRLTEERAALSSFHLKVQRLGNVRNMKQVREFETEIAEGIIYLYATVMSAEAGLASPEDGRILGFSIDAQVQFAQILAQADGLRRQCEVFTSSLNPNSDHPAQQSILQSVERIETTAETLHTLCNGLAVTISRRMAAIKIEVEAIRRRQAERQRA